MHRKFVLTLINLIASASAFIFVTFAWLTISTTVQNSSLSFNIDPGVVDTWDIHYFTYNHVYKISDLDGQLRVWDGDSWELPTYTRAEDSGYSFEGLMMKPYDMLIDKNNELNHIMIEIHMTYNVDSDVLMNFVALADSGIASDAIAEFNDPSNPNPSGTNYYLSEVVYVQQMFTSDYAIGVGGRTDTTNLYNALFYDFEDTITYEQYSFYGLSDTYSSILSLEDFSFTQASSPGELYIYICLSYYPDKVTGIVTYENDYSTGDTNPDFYRFFQDIVFNIKQSSGS